MSKSKYRAIDWRPAIEAHKDKYYKDVHILFRMAMSNPGEIIFWKDALGNEYCAVYDAIMQEMHTDLDEMHTNL